MRTREAALGGVPLPAFQALRAETWTLSPAPSHGNFPARSLLRGPCPPLPAPVLCLFICFPFRGRFASTPPEPPISPRSHPRARRAGRCGVRALGGGGGRRIPAAPASPPFRPPGGRRALLLSRARWLPCTRCRAEGTRSACGDLPVPSPSRRLGNHQSDPRAAHIWLPRLSRNARAGFLC